ncbi:hypothetical protein GJAV_G00221900 [Gymnothorax javanicus]|nr:hypothetical protein GJAV_G00221900 [Gymnothorax javanicus]
MGRLDDAAKRKVVELRKAGLSFRKIKAVLELENIKVSAQAIYLFLREFQGRNRQEEAGGGARSGSGVGGGVAQPGGAVVAIGDGSDGAGGRQAWGRLRDSSCPSGYASPQDSSQPGGGGGGAPRGVGRQLGGAADGAGRSEQQGGENDDEIRIVSVTSLARGNQRGGLQGAGAMMGAGVRRRPPMSPASSAILVARKKLLDKALLHKVRMSSAQPGPQAGMLYSRGQASFQGGDSRKVTVLPQTSAVGLTPARPPQARGGIEAQPVSSLPKRTLQPRASPPTRPLHPPLPRDPPPCITVRPPNPAPALPAGQGAASSIRPPNPSPRKDLARASPDSGLRGGLQEQMQALGAEIRGLGVAVRMMMEQQCRVEREQVQQTQVQRQILSTLQALASSLPVAPPTPPGPAPPPYRQDRLTPTRPTYAQCSQPPLSKYCELDTSSLDSLEPYKLPELGSPRVNGFQACGGADGGLGLVSAQAHTPTYTPPYAEPNPEVFVQPYGSPSYTAQSSHQPAYSQAYPESHAQPSDYPITSAATNSLPGCSPVANLNPESPIPLSPNDPQLNIIKVETM